VDQHFQCLDGNEAAARVAYAVSEVISIYPITPRLADGLDQRIRFVSALAIIDGDSGASLSKRSDDRCSDTTGASGHQCDPAMQGTCCHEHLRLALY